MTTEHANNDEWKRLVTTEGLPVGWVRRVSDDEWHVRPKPGLLRGCDSWIAPSWREQDRLTLDTAAIVGEGNATVVLAAETKPDPSGEDAADDERLDDGELTDDTPQRSDTRF